jgi:hypothetical protein
MRFIPRPLLAGLLLAALLGMPAGAHAQFRYGANPGSGFDYAQTQAVANCAADRSAFRYSPVVGGGGFWPYPIQDPVNGFLTGAADVINASGQYEIQHQQANLTRQQVKSAHIDNRRKMFDELRYEKENTPTQWQRQQEDFREQVMQARNNPPDTEIWSGGALNLLLQNIRNYESQMGLRGALIPLDPDTLKHISLGTGTVTGSSTMLNNGGKLRWPPELDDSRFDDERKSINELFMKATQEAAGPEGLSGRTMSALNKSLDELQDSIDGAITDMSPSDNIRAKSFANEVTRSARLLRDPNIAKQINGDWAAKGNTVGELVENMNRTGQKFGPAGPADRPFYSSLYQSMLAYDSSLMAMASRAGTSPGLKP